MKHVKARELVRRLLLGWELSGPGDGLGSWVPKRRPSVLPSYSVSLPSRPHAAQTPKNDTNICQPPTQKPSSSRDVYVKQHQNETGLTKLWPSAVTLPVQTRLLAVLGGALSGSHCLALRSKTRFGLPINVPQPKCAPTCSH